MHIDNLIEWRSLLGGEQFINTLKKGDFFGERALEDSQGKRTANIIANPRDDGGKAICIKSYYWWSINTINVESNATFLEFFKSINCISGLTTCLVIDRYSYKQMISNKFAIPDYEKITKKATMDNEFKALRLRDLRIVATLGVGGTEN